jgi:DNA repair protein RecO (recombination protein O)
MTANRVILQPAFVLHSRSYRETSLLVDLLTMNFGRLTVIARGARSAKSKFRGILSPFLPLLISFDGKKDLSALQQAEMRGVSYAFLPKVLLSGFYLNELLTKLLPIHESYPEIYQAYQNTLETLEKSLHPEIALRLFEKCLLINLGYGLQLDRTIAQDLILPEKQYVFEFGYGLKLAKIDNPMNFLGKNLLALHTGNLKTEYELNDAKRLLRGVLATLLGNKILKSRELFLYTTRKLN